MRELQSTHRAGLQAVEVTSRGAMSNQRPSRSAFLRGDAENTWGRVDVIGAADRYQSRSCEKSAMEPLQLHFCTRDLD